MLLDTIWEGGPGHGLTLVDDTLEAYNGGHLVSIHLHAHARSSNTFRRFGWVIGQNLRMTENRRLETAAPAMKQRMRTLSRVRRLLLLPTSANT